jgi:uncharacterized membrane protein YidH (DUF202 family)
MSDTLQRLLAGWLALIALMCALQSWRNWMQTETALRTGRPLPGSIGKLPLAAGIAVVAVALIGSVIFR